MNIQVVGAVVTMVVFDWDNTLFPTKAGKLFAARSSPGNPSTLTQSEFAELKALSQWVYGVLRAYIARYTAQNIRIVTAAKRGWVESCLARVGGIGRWSQIRALLFDAQQPIQIICPHNAILPFSTPKEILIYKYNAFRFVVQGAARLPSMLVSIGDSSAEYIASKKCAEGFDSMCVGRVKLQRHPSLRCLIRQCQCILDLCGHLQPESFDIDMS